MNLLSLTDCTAFATLLNNNNARLTVCNFTNIHHYTTHDLIKQTTRELTNYASRPIILYAVGHIADTLYSVAVRDIADYLAPNHYHPEQLKNVCHVKIKKASIKIELDDCISEVDKQKGSATTVLTTHGLFKHDERIQQDIEQPSLSMI